jgi:hypothetical protein
MTRDDMQKKGERHLKAWRSSMSRFANEDMTKVVDREIARTSLDLARRAAMALDTTQRGLRLGRDEGSELAVAIMGIGTTLGFLPYNFGAADWDLFYGNLCGRENVKTPSILPPFQLRVIAEERELSGKIDRLKNFLGSKVMDSLPKPEQERLEAQYLAMCAYDDILKKRISIFSEQAEAQSTKAEDPNAK